MKNKTEDCHTCACMKEGMKELNFPLWTREISPGSRYKTGFMRMLFPELNKQETLEWLGFGLILSSFPPISLLCW